MMTQKNNCISKKNPGDRCHGPPDVSVDHDMLIIYIYLRSDSISVNGMDVGIRAAR
jgi:hypothetical protein